jgi:8-amino-7-oxononanoate synthase
MSSHWEEIRQELDAIRKKNLFRECKLTSGIDFCSNDYLGLAHSAELKSALKTNANHFTTGSTASRLVKGHRLEMETFEKAFSNFVTGEDALLVSTGYVANLGLIDTIADSRSLVFTDRLNHASILDGIRISGAIKKYYDHLDLAHLEEQLIKASTSEENRNRKRIIVSETLFSMDGDIPDLKKLFYLKKKYNCILILDEAHSFGVFGKEGQGMCHEYLSSDEINEIEYRVYTLGKSMGLEGGIIVTSKFGREYLVNRMRSFIFSTAPLPLISATALDSLRLLKAADKERLHLQLLAKRFREGMIAGGFRLSHSVSHIVPVLMESEIEALMYSEHLSQKGFDVRAIRPPTVATSRLRVSLNARITFDELESLLQVFLGFRAELDGKNANRLSENKI